MKNRYAHKLRPFGVGEMPGIILCVHSEVEQAYQSDADAYGFQKLSDWAGCVMRRTNSLYITGATQTGETQADFWQWVRSNCNHAGKTWIYSVKAREQVAILGLWELILSRDASITGADPWTRLDSPKAKGKGRDGFVILEDPPTVVCFSLCDMAGSFVWVDPANYGADDLGGPFDAVIHVEAVNDWVDSYVEAIDAIELGGLEHTAASQAMSGFRRTYMQHDIYVHDNIPTLNLERAGLYGGRCECSFVGTIYGDGELGRTLQGDEIPAGWKCTDGPIYHLDVNSLYPSVAIDARLPVKLISAVENFPVIALEASLDKIAGVARILVETDVPCVPARRCTNCRVEYRVVNGKCWACKGRDSSVMIFPTGKFWTTLTTPELCLAFDLGKVHKCSRFAGYETAVIYRDWVSVLYNARKRAEAAGANQIASCYKRLLNASFGKWAQRSRRWISKPEELCMKPFSQWWQVSEETGEAEQWRSFAWAVERCEVVGEQPESMPIITAVIHALGRHRLWCLMEKAGRNSVYYCDTDSLWVNENGYKTLAGLGEVDANELGKLKVVAKHRVVTFWGQKRYKADGKLVVAGAPLGAETTGDAFAITMRQDPIQSYLYRDLPPGTEVHAARVRLNLPYTVGKVGPDGTAFPLKVVDTEDDR